mgnify:CR=1 FL=1
MTRSIILLRGLTRGTHHWGEFPKQLKAAFGHQKIIPIDLAGNGDRYKEASPVSIKLALEDIRNEVKKLKQEGPVTILALSLGGMITLQWLNDYPDEIDKAIIINSSHAGLSPLTKRMRPLSILKLLLAILQPISLRESSIYSLTSNNPINKELLEQWITEAKNHPVSLANAYRQAQAARKFKTRINIDATKLLILASENDRLVNVDCSIDIAKSTQSNIKYHTSAGHEVTLDDPLWVIYQAKEFIK